MERVGDNQLISDLLAPNVEADEIEDRSPSSVARILSDVPGIRVSESGIERIRIRGEDAFRTIFLYPFALSAVITGLVWQLMLDPIWGFQAAVRSWGFPDFTFAPLASAETALFGMIVATVWNGVGVTMAILLAGLRGVDEEIWKAAKIDGIPTWRTYLSIVLPSMRGSVATALILLTVNAVRTFDIVIAMTGGGPGISTQMPATYVIDNINSRNVAHGMAAATCMLLPIAVLVLLQAVFRARAARSATR